MNLNRIAKINEDYTLSVSSVLNKDVKQFGKKHLTDANEETCWHSDQGEYQWIACQFKNDFRLSDLNIQFQGGFSAQKIIIKFYDNQQNVIDEKILFPEDNNLFQKFANIENNNFVKLIKVLLLDCSDMFGRVIVYNFEIIGSSM